MNTVNVLLDKIEDWKRDCDTLEQVKLTKTSTVPLVLKDDPIALAWASYRQWTENPVPGNRWADLDTVTVADIDREMSIHIRKYYGDRIMMSMLSGNSITEFRKKLYGLITNSIELSKQDVGLLYRLPYFYVEDTAVDRVVAQTTSVTQHSRIEITTEYSLLECVLKSRRAGDYSQFWLKSKNDTAAYSMVIKCDNPYHRLVTKLLEQPVKLSGWAHPKHFQGQHRQRVFYYLADIALA